MGRFLNFCQKVIKNCKKSGYVFKFFKKKFSLNVFVKDFPHLQRAIRRWIRVTKNKNNRGHTTTGLGRQKPLNESERLLLETDHDRKKESSQ